MDVQQIRDTIHKNILKFSNKDFDEFYVKVVEKSAKELCLSHAELETILIEYHWYSCRIPFSIGLSSVYGNTYKKSNFHMGFPLNSKFSRFKSK